MCATCAVSAPCLVEELLVATPHPPLSVQQCCSIVDESTSSGKALYTRILGGGSYQKTNYREALASALVSVSTRNPARPYSGCAKRCAVPFVTARTRRTEENSSSTPSSTRYLRKRSPTLSSTLHHCSPRRSRSRTRCAPSTRGDAKKRVRRSTLLTVVYIIRWFCLMASFDTYVELPALLHPPKFF